MKKTRPINITADGCAFALRARYADAACLKGLTGGGGYYPCTGVIEVYEQDNIESKIPNGKEE